MTAGPENQGQAPTQGARSEKEYFGALKSYNERRGFGFIACAETAAEFGRDVYMTKEAALEAAEDMLARTQVSCNSETTKVKLAEGDLVRFTMKLSIEGFPQAGEVRCLQKFRGKVIRSPSQEEGSKPGRVKSEDVAALNGTGEVLVSQEACGHVRLLPGDEVSFCIPDLEGVLEAKLVMLEQSDRPTGSVLGCCVLHLPRPFEGQAAAPLSLDCHGFSNKLILSGLPADVGEAELMRFFAKQGATKVIAAHARACSFASVDFPSMRELATFLGRNKHTFSDDKVKETHIAELQEQVHSCHPRLPALPAPTVSPGDGTGSILVEWTTLQLAAGYFVELRPAGTAEEWALVDVDGSKGFDVSTSCCKVNGLCPGFAYEARASYVSACGCQSEASDASQPQQATLQPPFEAVALSGWPGATPAQAASPISPKSISLGASFFPPQPHGESQLPQPPAVWRCLHGATHLPPPVPELHQGDDSGFSVVVRWPSVAHATAYVVELREAGSPIVERIMRQADAAPVVELRVGGLRPLYGQQYAAQVRCVTGCGCESCPSDAAFSPPVTLLSQPRSAEMLGTSPPVWQQGQTCSRTAAPPEATPVAGSPIEVAPPTEMEPSATKSQEFLAKAGPEMVMTHKEPPPPEVTGQEDCLILD